MSGSFQISRRGFLGLLAAPAIVRVGSLMPIQSLDWMKNPCAEILLPPGIYEARIEGIHPVQDSFLMEYYIVAGVPRSMQERKPTTIGIIL